MPGEKPYMTSDKLPDSRSKFLCIHLWMTRRIWHCIKSHLKPYSTHPFNCLMFVWVLYCIFHLPLEMLNFQLLLDNFATQFELFSSFLMSYVLLLLLLAFYSLLGITMKYLMSVLPEVIRHTWQWQPTVVNGRCTTWTPWTVSCWRDTQTLYCHLRSMTEATC